MIIIISMCDAGADTCLSQGALFEDRKNSSQVSPKYNIFYIFITTLNRKDWYSHFPSVIRILLKGAQV
jgi:hypothetical protein